MPVASRVDCFKNINELTEYPNNSRVHPESQVNQLAEFIKSVGYIDPVIIDENNMILAGHGRVMACTKAGIDSVPCVQVTGLTDSEKKAYVIADNQLAINAEWDPERMKREIVDLNIDNFDISLLGFDGNFVSDLLSKGEEFLDPSRLFDEDRMSGNRGRDRGQGRTEDEYMVYTIKVPINTLTDNMVTLINDIEKMGAIVKREKDENKNS